MPQLDPQRERSKNTVKSGYPIVLPHAGTHYFITAHAALLDEQGLIDKQKKHRGGSGLQEDAPLLAGRGHFSDAVMSMRNSSSESGGAAGPVARISAPSRDRAVSSMPQMPTNIQLPRTF